MAQLKQPPPPPASKPPPPPSKPAADPGKPPAAAATPSRGSSRASHKAHTWVRRPGAQVPQGHGLLAVLAHGASISAVAVKTRGKTRHVYTGGGERVSIWDLSGGAKRSGAPDPVASTNPRAGSAVRRCQLIDGQRVVVAVEREGLAIVDMANCASAPLELQCNSYSLWPAWAATAIDRDCAPQGEVRCLGLRPPAPLCYAGMESGDIAAWDVARCELIRVLCGHTAAVAGISVAADAVTMISGAVDGSLRVWNLPTCSSTELRLAGEVTALASGAGCPCAS